jgi:hypothetical protein
MKVAVINGRILCVGGLKKSNSKPMSLYKFRRWLVMDVDGDFRQGDGDILHLIRS